jgi:misacylated tRNA(Ala) deacylase
MSESKDILGRSHSAEHVLNAVMQRDFGTGRSVGAHFGPKKSKCDYVISRPLTTEDWPKIEAAVNAEIRADHPVTTFEISREEADARYNMGKVPDSATAIRIVQIGDLDVIPCVGQHVEHTGQLGRFVIKSADMKDETTVRIRFALEA